MSVITVWRGETGEIEGYGEKDKRAYRRLMKAQENLAPGEMFEIEYWFPRSGPFHRLHMKMISGLFSNQEQFTSFERFRDWMKVGAGYADLYPGPQGQLVAVPQSISFKKMDDEQMRSFHEDTKRFLTSEHALMFLYPQVSVNDSFDWIDIFLTNY